MNSAKEPAPLNLEAFTYDTHSGVLPDLLTRLNEGGGWILGRRAISAASVEIRIELRLTNILDLYGVMMAAGIELTSQTHDLLTDLCTCRRNAESLSGVGRTLVLRLVLHFRDRLVVGVSPIRFAAA